MRILYKLGMAEWSSPTGLPFRLKLAANLAGGEAWNKDSPLNGLPAGLGFLPSQPLPRVLPSPQGDMPKNSRKRQRQGE